ncbi:hypothetical protein ACLOJK_027018 [Asimina triloba]
MGKLAVRRSKTSSHCYSAINEGEYTFVNNIEKTHSSIVVVVNEEDKFDLAGNNKEDGANMVPVIVVMKVGADDEIIFIVSGEEDANPSLADIRGDTGDDANAAEGVLYLALVINRVATADLNPATAVVEKTIINDARAHETRKSTSFSLSSRMK